MKLIKREAAIMPDPEIDSSIKEVPFDEMWHFVEQKNGIDFGLIPKTEDKIVIMI